MKTLNNLEICLSDAAICNLHDYVSDGAIRLPKGSDSLFGFIVKNTNYTYLSYPNLRVDIGFLLLGSKRGYICIRDVIHTNRLSHVFFSWR